jgi:chromosome segregation ATPase
MVRGTRWCGWGVVAVSVAMAFAAPAFAQQRDASNSAPANPARQNGNEATKDEVAALRAQLELAHKELAKAEAVRRELQQVREEAERQRQMAEKARRQAQAPKTGQVITREDLARVLDEWEQIWFGRIEQQGNAPANSSEPTRDAENSRDDSPLGPVRIVMLQEGESDEGSAPAADARDDERRKEFLRRLIEQRAEGGKDHDARAADRRGDRGNDTPAAEADSPSEDLSRQLRRQEQRLERVERQLERLHELLSRDRGEEAQTRQDRELGRMRAVREEEVRPLRGRDETRMAQNIERQLNQVRSRMAHLSEARDRTLQALRQAELELRQVEVTREALARRVQEQQAGLEALEQQLRQTGAIGQKLEQRLQGRDSQPQDRPAREPAGPNAI